jgi:GNAT superfamily N-acetyltransferase
VSVGPDFRRRGFGRVLVDAAAAYARCIGGVRQLKLAGTPQMMALGFFMSR